MVKLDCANDWTTKKIQDIISLEYDENLTSGTRSGSGFPVFGSNGIIGYHAKSLVSGPGIIIGRKGSIGEVRLSKVDFWPIDTTYYVHLKEPLELKWLYYLLIYLRLGRLNSATGIPGLNRDLVYKIRILFPSLPEQQKIASILTTVDKAIEGTDKIIEQCEKVKKGLMQTLLTRGIPGRHKKFKKTELGEIPEEWEVLPLEKLVSLLKDGSHNPPPSRNIGIPLLSATNIYDGKIHISETTYFIDQNGYDEIHKKYDITTGDVLLTTVGSIGRIAYVENESPFSIQRSITLVRSNHLIKSQYMYYVLQSPIIQKQLQKRSNTTAQSGVYLAELGKISVPFPVSYELQNEIVQILSSIDLRIKLENSKKHVLMHSKKALMQKLLSGQIRVKI